MNATEIKEIMTLIEQSPIEILKLEKGDFKLYYEKERATEKTSAQTPPTTDVIEEKIELPIAQATTNLHTITSPTIGTFYTKPSADAAPFVQIGAQIQQDEPLCILEAMKLLHEVTADVDGEIIEILAVDGDIIEFGQPLFTVKVRD